MNQLILHIPHSSSNIPFYEGYVRRISDLHKEIIKLTDWFTEEIFNTPQDIQIIAPFSRIFCDVERFSDDSKERMATKGMGVIYETTDSGEPLRFVSQELRDRILKEFYFEHHLRFENAVAKELKVSEKVIIVDCHSFPDKPLKRDIDQSTPRPDFNIGTDEFHTPQKMIELSEKYFKDLGFSVGIDKPYSGSIVPLKYYKSNPNVMSIMVEINRRLYLEEGTNRVNNIYDIDLQNIISKYLNLLRTHLSEFLKY
jgi:N-formylglutamate amidohydrolase